MSIGVKLESKGRPALAERPRIRTYLLKNTSCFPKDYSSLSPDTHCMLFPVSASHSKTSADGMLHRTYNILNPESTLPAVVCCNSCLPSSDTSVRPFPPRPGGC